MRLRWLLAFALIVPFTGCIGTDGVSWSEAERATAAWPAPDAAVVRRDATDPDPDAATRGGAAEEPAETTGTGDAWHNVTADSLADCRILYNLVSAGIPATGLPQHVSVALDEGAGTTYAVYLAAADGSTLGPTGLAGELCIGFTRGDVRVGYSDETTGMVPDGADRMFIAGDLLVPVEIAVRVGDAVPPDPAPGWSYGPWPLVPVEPREPILIA